MTTTGATHASAMGGHGQEYCPFMPTYGAPPVLFVSGEGPWLTDLAGKRYLDFLCGLAVTGLGHAHPEVTEAIASQAATLTHVSNLFANRPAADLAARIDHLLGGGGQLFMCNSGAEANEAALKLARRWGGPGRSTIMATWGGFHGRTMGALAATGQPAKQEPFLPLPEGFRHATYGDVADLERQVDPTTCAVLVEPILGEGGVVVPPEGYLTELRRLCDERDLLLMIDEVQTGLGRTGDWFGFQHESVQPDVVTMAKALGNGMPIGACWARQDVAGAFTPGDHGTTYGGQPLAAAAALRTIAVLEDMDAPMLARTMGERFRAGLATLPGVAEVRGRGLLLAAELNPSLDAREVARRALDRGVIVNAVTATAIRLAPPFILTTDEIDEGLDLLSAALSDCLAREDAS